MDFVRGIARHVTVEGSGSGMVAFFLVLLAIDLTLVATHLSLLQLPPVFQPLLDLDAEASIPAWYSSLKMVGIGAMLLLVAYRAADHTLTPIALGLLGLFFVAMSLDEVVGLHERVGFLIDLTLFDRTDTAVSATGLWFLVLGLPALASLFYLIYRSAKLLDLVPGTSIGILAGAALFFLGALAFEGLTNAVNDPAAYHLLVALEEGTELAGLSVILVVLVRCIGAHPLTTPLVELARAPAAGNPRRRERT